MPIMNEQKINEAFTNMDRAFAETEKECRQTADGTSPNLRINLKNRRWPTFVQLAKSAVQMLFTGKTSIVVRKH